MFNIIGEKVIDSKILDLFAGTGSIGIEALSRGAKYCVFIDKSSECIKLIKENLLHTKLIDKTNVILNDAFKGINWFSTKGDQFDIIYVDPPYDSDLAFKILVLILDKNVLAKDGVIILEHNIYNDSINEENIYPLILIKKKKYGDTLLSFYRK